MKAKILVTVTILLLIVAFVQASEVKVTFQEGVNGYTVTRDTYLNEYEPGTPHGSDWFVCVDSYAYRDDGLLWFAHIFDDEGGPIPLGSKIIDAKLTLRVEPSGLDETGATVHRMLQPWDENDTWNEWVNGIDADNIEALSKIDALVPEGHPLPDPLIIDVIESVQAWSDGYKNYGWVFLAKPISQYGWDFYSSDESDISLRPHLEVIYIPEPGTVLLLGFGTMLLRKRRKLLEE